MASLAQHWAHSKCRVKVAIFVVFIAMWSKMEGHDLPCLSNILQSIAKKAVSLSTKPKRDLVTLIFYVQNSYEFYILLSCFLGGNICILSLRQYS